VLKKNQLVAAGSVAITALLTSAAALADHPRKSQPEWGSGQLVITGGGCPIETPDGLSLMMASGRTGGVGDLDIWALDRASIEGVWSEPKNLPQPVNSLAADFCPTPFERSLYFVSTRPHPEACGGGDIFLARQSPAGDWSEPVHLPCAPNGPNTPGTERSPSLVETWYGTFLFFSTNGGVADADDDIYVSQMKRNGEFSEGRVVHALSSNDFQDQMPTVRAREDGTFEIVFNSDRTNPGPGSNGVSGGQDVYYAKARLLPYWWSVPSNVGPNVNTSANETRAALSHDGKRLYVGRGDIYVSERQ
jgi:hypothetical protein